MDTEKLKIIAEGMGYEIFSNDNPRIKDRLVVWNGKDIHTRCIYKPLTNNDQMVEIMEKLKITVRAIPNVSEDWFAEPYPYGNRMGSGKTINEAACNAAYEYFKGE